MAYEQKDNEFILSLNKYKTDDKHPSYKGTIKIAGVTYDLAAWIKKDAEGKSFFTGKMSEHVEKQKSGQADDPLNPTPTVPSDDLPF